MKHIVLLLCLWLFGVPVFAYVGQPDSESVVILYNDRTGIIELKPIMWVQGCCSNFGQVWQQGRTEIGIRPLVSNQ